MKEILKKVRALLKNGTLKLVRTTQDERILIAGNSNVSLQGGHMFLRRLFYKEYGVFVEAKKVQAVIDYLDMQPLTDEAPYETACRIYCKQHVPITNLRSSLIILAVLQDKNLQTWVQNGSREQKFSLSKSRLSRIAPKKQ